MIRAVLFDFGGVLTTGGKAGSVRQSIAKILGVEPEAIQISDLHKQLRHGTISDEQFFVALNERYGHIKTITKANFMEAADLFNGSPEVYKLAEDLRTAGIKTGIVSNVFEMTAEVLRTKGLYDGFEPVVLSYQERAAKPEIEIYQAALNKLATPSQEVLFIDDQESSLVPARELGMHTILAISADQIVTDVKTVMERENGLKL